MKQATIMSAMQARCAILVMIVVACLVLFTQPMVDQALADPCRVASGSRWETRNLCERDGAFITTWETTTPKDYITFWASGKLIVDWGDGRYASFGHDYDDDTRTTTLKPGGGQFTNWYGEPGIHEVVIYGDLYTFSAHRGGTGDKLASVEQWGDSRWVTLKEAFRGTKFSINADDAPDLSLRDYYNLWNADGSISYELSSRWRGPDVGGMFAFSSFDGDLSHWNVTSVTNMAGMFGYSNFNGDISSWDVSNVEKMTGMFLGSSFNQDISSWDVSNVRYMNSMFARSPFNQDISSWDVSNVWDMREMFSRSPFNQDISSWDVSNVWDMNAMFLNSPFNGDISSWDVSNVEDMGGMFYHASSFNQDISSWDVSNVQDMSGMFNSASSFNQDISSWDVSNVRRLGGMFLGDSSFNQNLGDWFVTLDDRAATYADPVVGKLTPQNPSLQTRTPISYEMVHPDDGTFLIEDGNILVMNPDPDTAAGYYNVTIRATPITAYIPDNTKQVTVRYAMVPEDPITLASQFQNVVPGQWVTLDGTGPWDPAGYKFTYRWSQTGGINVTLTDYASPTPAFVAPDTSLSQVLAFTLEISDAAGDSTEATAFVFVLPDGGP